MRGSAGGGDRVEETAKKTKGKASTTIAAKAKVASKEKGVEAKGKPAEKPTGAIQIEPPIRESTLLVVHDGDIDLGGESGDEEVQRGSESILRSNNTSQELTEGDKTATTRKRKNIGDSESEGDPKPGVYVPACDRCTAKGETQCAYAIKHNACNRCGDSKQRCSLATGKRKKKLRKTTMPSEEPVTSVNVAIPRTSNPAEAHGETPINDPVADRAPSNLKAKDAAPSRKKSKATTTTSRSQSSNASKTTSAAVTTSGSQQNEQSGETRQTGEWSQARNVHCLTRHQIPPMPKYTPSTTSRERRWAK